MSDLMHMTAVFGDGGRYRYSLSREWDPRIEQLCWIMLNPSIASADRDDPTIRRCISFAKMWAFGGIVVVNLFGLVATYPVQLMRAKDPVGPHNDEAIEQAIAGRRVVCAWGDVYASRIKFGDRVTSVMALLERTRTNPLCMGLTKSGHPRHPVRLGSNTTMKRFVLKDTGKLFRSIKYEADSPKVAVGPIDIYGDGSRRKTP